MSIARGIRLPSLRPRGDSPRRKQQIALAHSTSNNQERPGAPSGSQQMAPQALSHFRQRQAASFAYFDGFCWRRSRAWGWCPCCF
jgi:hypothetical protein